MRSRDRCVEGWPAGGTGVRISGKTGGEDLELTGAAVQPYFVGEGRGVGQARQLAWGASGVR